MGLYKVLLFALTLFSASVAFTPTFDFANDKVRGVNLGGWLVIEPWITPSLFDGLDDRVVDEYTFCHYQPSETVRDTLQHHWDTWITESDFEEISQTGLNHVRIPIGYWAFGTIETEPYISGQFLYLNKSIAWAEKYNLKVIISLHGAPGSQNGLDNSGQATNVSWYREQSNVDRTREVLRQLISMYKNNPVVTAISVLNAPWPQKTLDPDQMLSVLTQFYYDSYQDIRHPDQSTESNAAVIYSDAFQGLEYWKYQDFMVYPTYQGVFMDIHKYQMFTDHEVGMTYDEHITAACAQSAELETSRLWVIVGEWSPAATDCAAYLNGRFLGSRYDGSLDKDHRSAQTCEGLTGNAEGFSKSYKKFLGEYWQAQASTYERAAAGWVQWTWKTENAHEWSYQAGWRYKWIRKVGVEQEREAQYVEAYPDPAFCENRALSLAVPSARVPGWMRFGVWVFCAVRLLGGLV